MNIDILYVFVYSYFLTKRNIFFWLSLFFGFGIGLVRIMEGGHFVSDIVMAAMILYLSYYLQMKYYFNTFGSASDIDIYLS